MNGELLHITISTTVTVGKQLWLNSFDDHKKYMMKFEIIIFITIAVVLFSTVTTTEANPTTKPCTEDSDCSSVLACRHNFCVDPCRQTWDNHICTVKNHVAEYTCKPGFKFIPKSTFICIPMTWKCNDDPNDPHTIKCKSSSIGTFFSEIFGSAIRE